MRFGSAHRDVAAVAMLRMGDGNARHHLQPVCTALAPATVIIIRPSSQPAGVYGPNAVTIDTSQRNRGLEVLWTFLVTLWVTLRTRPDRLLSFNGIPYGMVATWIGGLTRTPVHVGFVGTETSHIERRPWLLRLFGPVSLATTTGTSMSRRLARHGLGTRIEILRHGIDAERFHASDDDRDIDVVFVGALIPRKRVDLLLDVLVRARTRRPGLTAVIIGDGPEASRLHEVQHDLDLHDSVRFVGHDPTPEQWLQRAELLLMASSWEGLPFAVVEAMRCGAVPVTNDIGTVTDLVRDGTSGVVVATNPDPQQLADTIVDLLDDRERLTSLRAGALAATSDLTYDALADWWAEALGVPA